MKFRGIRDVFSGSLFQVTIAKIGNIDISLSTDKNVVEVMSTSQQINHLK